MYRPLPTLTAQQPEEPAALYGLRVLTFVLATGVTATLSTPALEAADHAAIYAVASRDICLIALERISAARTQIAHALRFRALETASAPAPLPAPVAPTVNPRGGQRAALQPPLPRRPSPATLATPF